MSDSTEKRAVTLPAQQSRQGKRVVSGYFDPAVAQALRTLAAELDTTVQSVMARAFNDFLEKYGRGRPADETPLARGGAAHRKTDVSVSQ
jgi:hypothetical protein